jgi:hypothetical protein
MHSKNKGNIGQFATGLAFAKLGYSVFTEEGDISKIDLIAEKDGKVIKVQSKAITPKNNALQLVLKKSGPNYQFKYKPGVFDYFSVVDLSDGKVYLIPDSVLFSHSSSLILRKSPSKNNQKNKINLADDYLIEKVLGTTRPL